MILGNVITLLLGLLFLVIGSNFLVTATDNISVKFKISGFMASFFLIGMATSAPEIFISIESALQNKTELAIGNVLGSNISNIAIVFCFSVLFLKSKQNMYIPKRSLSSLVLITIISFLLITNDNQVNFLDAIILILAMILALLFMNDKHDTDMSDNNHMSVSMMLIYLSLGFGLLVYGAEFFILGATDIAIIFGISSYIIGLTLTAIGTSLPELAASIQSAMRGRGDFIVGNIIGSNIFNISIALSTAAIINIGIVQETEIIRDYILIFITTMAFYLIMKSSNIVIKYIISLVVIIIYIIYIYSVLI